MDKKDFFGPFFKKKVRFFYKKIGLWEKLPRGFEITNVISVKEDGGRFNWLRSPTAWVRVMNEKKLFFYFGCEFLDFF